jgi:hypothetical protein
MCSGTVVDLSWFWTSTDGSLPIVIVCHAAIDAAGELLLPEFADADHQSCGGSCALVEIVVVIVAGPNSW